MLMKDSILSLLHNRVLAGQVVVSAISMNVLL